MQNPPDTSQSEFEGMSEFEQNYAYLKAEDFLTELTLLMEVDPKTLKPGETVKQRQQKIIQIKAKMLLSKLIGDVKNGAQGAFIYNLDFPEDPSEIFDQVMSIAYAVQHEKNGFDKTSKKIIKDMVPDVKEFLKDVDHVFEDYEKLALSLREEVMRILEKELAAHDLDMKIAVPDDLLGKGGLGKAYSLYSRGDGEYGLKIGDEYIVIKIQNKPRYDENLMPDEDIERLSDATISAPNLVSFYGRIHEVVDEERLRAIDFYEELSTENYHDLLFERETINVDEEIEHIVLPILDGLAALHKNGLMHLDIKPSNVLFSYDGTPKLGDYDLVTEEGGTMKAGTSGYSSPEQLKGEPVTPKSDIYSIGATLLQIGTWLYSNHELSDSKDPNEINNIRLFMLFEENPELYEVVYKCLMSDPDDRPTLDELRSKLKKYLQKNLHKS